MTWTAPRTWLTGEIVTSDLLNTHVRDNLRYLKGLDGVPTIQAGLIVDNTLGTEYFKVPSLTTTQRNALSAAVGMIVYDSTLAQLMEYEGSAWKALKDAATLSIASQAQGDVLYYSGSAWARLGAGTSGHFLQTHGAGANPIWAAGPNRNSGTYSGDGTVNRAIAHGLGAAPKWVSIWEYAGTNKDIWYLISGNRALISSKVGLNQLQYAVTQPDATNFYVGNATDYEQSGNGTVGGGCAYEWIAFG